mgnify:CR=1 FL=1
MSDCINVAFNCSDAFVNGLLTTIYSLLINNKNYFFNIFSAGPLSEENKNKIKKFVGKKANLYFVEVDDTIFRSSLDEQNYFYIGLRRLLLPFILKDVDKLLYLDSDLIVNKDISMLWDADIGDCYIGSILDISSNNKIVEKFVRENNLDEYFNSGVILFDCKHIRKDLNVSGITDIIKSHELPYFDQDILNLLYRDRIFKINPTYNFQTFPDSLYKKRQLKHQSIVHYLGTKPWNLGYPITDPKFRFFWKYGIKTFGLFSFFKLTFTKPIVLFKIKFKRTISKIFH